MPVTNSVAPPVAAMPVIGVSTNVRELPDYKVHGATERSLYAVYEAAGGLPLMLPALGGMYDFATLVERLDGLLLTGSASHVAPSHYNTEHDVDDDLDPALKDPERDATTLPLIRVALAAGVPILALCRGIQELNVALGGTLGSVTDPLMHSRDGQPSAGAIVLRDWLQDHRHPATLTPGGLLATLLPDTTEIVINSAHSQTLAVLSPKLQVEAVAPDGVIEAVSVRNAKTFALGVQWHPEYLYRTDPQARALFEAFGAAARQRYAQRLLRQAVDQQEWAKLDISEPEIVDANLGS